MITGYGLVCLWVFDQDEAYDFYVRKLGFDVTFQQEMDGVRWLLVNPPGAPELPLALNVPGPPVMDEETAAAVRKLVSIGYAGGPGAFKTDDCWKSYAELKARGVEFIGEPEETFYGIDVAFRDPFGNHWRLTQVKPRD